MQGESCRDSSVCVGSGPGEVVEFDGHDAPKDIASKRARLESVRNLNVQFCYQCKGQQRSAAGKVVAIDGHFVVLDSESQNFAVPIEAISKMQVLELPLRVHVQGEQSDPPQQARLGTAWGGVLLAGVAMSVLIAGIVRLSRRRAAFVSAVTHELRTPLTTFQMYAEMLAEGMVPDPQQQHQYLATLRTEAARLTHLVENVLAYARLERGRGAGRVEPIEVGCLIDQLYPRLREHAARAGMELVLEEDLDVRLATIQGNASALEQILLNLVDNASKYAASASDRRIHLTVKRHQRREKGAESFVRDGRGTAGVDFVVRDHGPGIPAGRTRGLFLAFRKSAQEAAHTAPGIGLGLALSRRLAKDLGGQLRLDPAICDGAAFVLTVLGPGPGKPPWPTDYLPGSR